MRRQHKTVAQILYDKGADYLLPLKVNQGTLLETAQQLLPERVPPHVVKLEDNRGRLECAKALLPSFGWDDSVPDASLR